MAVPVTRDLAELIEACAIVEAELRFQAERLKNNVDASKSSSDPGHLDDLAAGYDSSARYVGILRRYQEGRFERARVRAAFSTTGGMVSGYESHRGDIDPNGRAVAHTEDEA